MTDAERSHVQGCIDTVVARFRRTPNVFLTEDDLRIHLCSELLKHFDRLRSTPDGDYSIELHAEIRWYGGTEGLTLRSDIVLIDVSTLDVRRHARMPSKGFGFNVPKGIIELKFRRPNGKSNNKWIEDIQADVSKLELLQPVFHEADAPTQTAYWVVALDKKTRIDPPQHSNIVHITYEHATQSEQDVEPDA